MKQKVCLITGGAGFLGRKYCEFFLKKRYVVICVDNNKKNLKSLKSIASKNLVIHECDITKDKKVENFYRELSVISSGISGVKVHLSSLRVDNNIIAAHLGLVHQSRFYYLTPAYLDGELSKFSPGSVLLHFLINWSIENKLEVFDLTIGDESYKGSWSNKRHYIYNILKPNSFSGWSFAYFIVALNFLKNNRFSRFLITRGIRFFRLLKVG